METIHYVVYDSTGIITKSGQCDSDLLTLQAGDGESAMEGQGDDQYNYVADPGGIPTIEESLDFNTYDYLTKTSIVADGVDFTNMDVPPGTTVDIVPGTDLSAMMEEQTGVPVDTNFLLKTNVPGTYTLIFKCFAYINKQYTIIATEVT